MCLEQSLACSKCYRVLAIIFSDYYYMRYLLFPVALGHSQSYYYVFHIFTKVTSCPENSSSRPISVHEAFIPLALRPVTNAHH